MRIVAAALAVLALTALASGEDSSEFEERARKARTPADAAALEREIPPARGDLYDFRRERIVDAVVYAWQRIGQPDAAVKLAERLRDAAAPKDGESQVSREAVIAEHRCALALQHANRLDDALAAAKRMLVWETRTQFPDGVDDGPDWVQVAVETRARIQERRGDYADALACYQRWRGSGYGLQIRQIQRAQRGTCIARCRWRLGQTDAALDLAFGTAMSEYTDFIDDDPIVWACEIAVRAGKLDALRKRIDGVGDTERRLRFERSFAVASAFAEKDAKALLDAVGASPNSSGDLSRLIHPEEGEFIVRYLREIGPDAVAELVARVRRGDARAVEVVQWAFVPEALPALRERRDAKDVTPDERRRIEREIDDIESAIPPR